ncbi:MAG: DUF3892 domain-containing protein [Comamonadaceae bacterium]|nr:MAG: DUF3892 domain-containing protein [Comamonadaceae bacterium]
MSLRVTGSAKDRNGDITGLCGPGWQHSKAEAIANIRANPAAYYVTVGVNTVYVREGTRLGAPYLTTSRDGVAPNNLDNLPDC